MDGITDEFSAFLIVQQGAIDFSHLIQKLQVVPSKKISRKLDNRPRQGRTD
jgi:hypothetical protein